MDCWDQENSIIYCHIDSYRPNSVSTETKFKQALRRQWFAGLRGSEPRLPPMTSEEESNLFCLCHLLNCDEGQGQ
jgi:hypothetical protein